ncbi:MAG: hypothetical protein LBJ00_01225 [Planctomycetaceae bacterium]|nr:hypothetical protein [Planctomycetaceae bacterium]
MKRDIQDKYTVAVRAIGFALEQPLPVVALACSVSRISKQPEYISKPITLPATV